MRRLLLALALMLLALPSQAATRTCSAAYTAACDTAGIGGGEYCDFADADTWGAAAPGASDVAVISGSCKVRMTASTTNQAVQITSESAELQVYVGAAVTPITYTLSTCNTTDATSFTYGDTGLECGAEAGTVRLTGTLIYDSRTSANTDVSNFAGGNSPASSGAQLRWFWLNDGENQFKAGDIVHVLSGPQRNLVYKVASVNDGSALIDVALYDPSMVYTTNRPNAQINQIFADGNDGGLATLPLAEKISIAGASDAAYEANNLDRLVTLCMNNGGTATNCTASTGVAANDVLSGWYLMKSGASSRYGNAADPRFLIKDVANDTATPITGDANTPDVIELVEPMTASLISSNSTLRENMVISPGFCPLCGDDFVVYRPARIAYNGSDGDGGLRFWDTRLVFDYFDLEDWAAIAVANPGTNTPADYPRMTFGRVVPWCLGDGTNLTNNGNNGCNGHAMLMSAYEDFALDHVFFGDSRTPIDTSTTCAGCSGSSPPADADIDTTSGTHGLGIGGHTHYGNATLNDIGCRYLGDDCIVMSIPSINTASSIAINGLTCWQMMIGDSGNCLDTGAANPAALTTYNVSNLIANNWSQNDPAITNSIGVNSLVNINRGFMLDGVQNNKLISGISPTAGYLWKPTESKVSNVIGIAAGATDNSFAESASVIGNWADGWRTLSTGGQATRRNYLRSQNTTAATALFGYTSLNDQLEVTDNVAVGMGAIVAITPTNVGPPSHVRAIVKNNALSYSTGAIAAFGTFGSNAPPLTFSGNIVRNTQFFNCSNATWGAANSATIGYNVAIVPATIPITNGSNCAAALARQTIMVDTPTFFDSWLVAQQLSGGTTGPQSRVGVSDPWARTEMGLTRAYTIQGGVGGGVGGDAPCVGSSCGVPNIGSR